jgi:hypothetical protein
MGSSITLEGRCGGINMSRRKNIETEIKKDLLNDETAVESNVVENEAVDKSNVAEKGQEAVIYCGASLAAGTLQQYSVFVNGIPEHLHEHIKKCPAIKGLMVPISKFQEVRKRIEEPGTAEHTLNAQILAYVRSGK